MTTQPSVISFGDVSVISPDGAIPAGLWPELAALVLLEPEPELRLAWIARLEAVLGVSEVHRAYIAGGMESVREYVRGNRATQIVIDEFSRVDPNLPFPGEGPEPTGHALTLFPDDLDEDKERRRRKRDGEAADRRRRIAGIRPEDERLSWFIARAATRMEARAERNLIEAGFAVYVPRLTYWRRTSRIRHRAELPLFSGYFFVGLGHKQTIEQVVETDGVHDVVRIQRAPREVAFPAILDLVGHELAGEFDRTRRDARKDPKPGTPVEIVSGQWRGWPAKFHERREDERVVVMMTMLGVESPLLLDPIEVDLPEVKP